MKPILSTLILTLSFALCGLAQNWNLEWEKQSGTRNQDFYTDVAETADGALVVLGARGEGASSDLWLLCFDAQGTKLWDRTLGSSEQDLPEKVLVLPNGELLILGKSGTGIQSHILLIQADAEGNELWTNAPESNKYCEAHDMCLLKEGGFLLAGGKGADTDHLFPWLAQFDQEGNLISEQNYGEVNGCLSSVKQLPNQDLILGGQSAGKSKNDCDMLVLRTDPNGQERWMNRMQASKSREWAECVCCSPDSCFMLVGWVGNCLNEIDSEYPIFDFDLVLKKIDRNGKELWSKNFDAEGSEGGNAITIRPDGNMLLAGVKLTSFSGKVGPWIIETDSQGQILNETLLNLKLTQACKVINTSDGGFVVIGPGMNEKINSLSDGWIAKFAEL